MFNFLCEDNATAAAPGINVGVYVILLVALVALIIFPMFTQRKRNREYEAMIGGLKVGDLVKTAGGTIGRIKSISDKGEIKTVILETGSKTEKSYMEFDITMIACVLKSTKTTAETAEESAEEEEDVEETEEVAETVESAPVEESVVEVVENPKEEATKVEEQVIEEKKPAKKTTAKKSTSTKSSVKKK